MTVADPQSAWIQTFTGRAFRPLAPRAADVSILDIAHALANKCRYTGHTRVFYSVAQHCVLVSEAVPAEDALWGLLHDAAEAYLPDVARPIKDHLPGFRDIEAGVMRAVCERYGLRHRMPDSVAEADVRILADESTQLMETPPLPWNLPLAPLGVLITPLSPAAAERAFLDRLHELAAQEVPA